MGFSARRLSKIRRGSVLNGRPLISFYSSGIPDGKHPTPLYYYRELQNLRDPLHFREESGDAMRKRRGPDGVEKQMQLDSRKKAVQRWAKNKIAPYKRSKS